MSRDCPSRDKTKERGNTSFVKTTSGQYILLQLLETSPPTLTQQITTQGIITPEAWVKIQEKVNALAENNELIDKRQKTLGQSHQKLKKLTKVIHKNTDPSRLMNAKSIPGKQDERKDKGKVKFTVPPSGTPTLKDKQVNVVQTAENIHCVESEHEESETTLPEDTSGSSDDSSRAKYFDLLLSSSEEYDSSNNSDDNEE